MDKQQIFLLGGYDLEMMEIKKIAESIPGVLLFDKHLSWDTADLDKYKDVLQQYENCENVVVYGIELHENQDVRLPLNYYRIDHHNQYSANLSALEQVAAVLKIELTREQQLIAANDRGYIPEMQQQGATADEIRQIRLRDRQAQGVTEEDEQLALQAIENKTTEQDIIVIKSETNRFSPICDNLYPYHKLLIYTDDVLMYYGERKERLTKYFASDINARKMFHGGGVDGYFGTVRAAYPFLVFRIAAP